MSQEIEKNVAAPGTGATGANCTKSGLYKATDGKIEMVQYIMKNTPFPFFPGGTGTTRCTWSALSRASDGNRSGFTAVKVAAGTQ